MNVLDMLDKKQHSGEQIAQNYQILKEKWGETPITSIGSIQIRYIDISKVFFNSASKTFLTLTIVSFVASVIFGKIVFPQLSKTYLSANKQMADLAAIQTSEIVKEKKNKGEWF